MYFLVSGGEGGRAGSVRGGFSRQERGWGFQDKLVSVKMWGEQVEYSKQILCF